MYEVVVEGPEVDLVEKIKKARSKDEDVVRVVKEMKKAGVRKLRGDEWKLEENLVLKEGKMYMPKDEELRAEVIWLHHDVPAAGHGGRWKTVELVTRNYWWPGVTRDVEKYVEGCDLCQRMKNRTEEPAGKLKLSEVPKKPWSHLTVDFITKLPVVAGKDTVLVVCDRLSKMTHFVATTEETSAEELARLFRDNVWKLHGLPESVVSDRGPQFVAELTKELNRMLVICKSTCPENYIPVVMPPLNPTSPPSTAAIFLATRLMAVLQPSGYSVFHSGDTPIQLSLS